MNDQNEIFKTEGSFAKKMKRIEYCKKYKNKQLLTNREEYLERIKKYNKEYYSKNKDKFQKYNQHYHAKQKETGIKNIKIHRKHCKDYYYKNRNNILKNQKKYRNKNIEYIKKRRRDYYYRNRDCILNKHKERYKSLKQIKQKEIETQQIPFANADITEKKPIMIRKKIIGKTRLKQRKIENDLKKLQLKKEQYLASILTNTELTI